MTRNTTGNEVVIEFEPKVERTMTVGLVANAVTALGELEDLLGVNAATVVNRALQVYAFVERELADGSVVMVKEVGGVFKKVTIA